jgi:hexosaminidase
MIGRDTAPAVRRLGRGRQLDTNTIYLRIDSSFDTTLGGALTRGSDEAYALVVARDRVTLTARTTEGLFRATQTLRQLFPWSVEHRNPLGKRLRLPGVRIEDGPRFAWRGSMLDVSRHFLPLESVKRHVDLMALYKLNRLHLHLSDDQGWRLEIRKYPRLTSVGGSTQVGGGPGGFYTQAQFRELVRYARDRHVMIIPEFDMPGHTNAALASVRALNCDRKAPPLYTGIKVGFSAVCAEREATYRWVDDVVREVAAISPAPYIHIGGDEVEKIPHAPYIKFVERVEKIVHKHGKRVIGWAEIAPAALDTSTIAQLWRGSGRDSTAVHAARGGKVLMSPGARMYLDMKHDSSMVLGLRWAGMVDLRTAYDWDPATYQPGVTEASIIGVEAPLWSETLVKYADFEYMAFPRLLAVAELGWTPQGSRDWEDFRARLVSQGQRLQALGVNFHRSPQVDWVP